MQIKLFNYTNHTQNLIVFFSGIGGNESLFSHLSLDASSSLVFIHDYENLDFEGPLNSWDDIHALSIGKKTSLIAWSMGVGMASYFLDRLDYFDIKIAINGTKTPIDAKSGIPPKIFSLTVKHINPSSFYHNVLESPPSSNMRLNTTTELQKELGFVYELFLNKQMGHDIWDFALISKDDKIFPTAAQIYAWHNTKTYLMPLPHFIFNAFYSWQDILHLKA